MFSVETLCVTSRLQLQHWSPPWVPPELDSDIWVFSSNIPPKLFFVAFQNSPASDVSQPECVQQFQFWHDTLTDYGYNIKEFCKINKLNHEWRSIQFQGSPVSSGHGRSNALHCVDTTKVKPLRGEHPSMPLPVAYEGRSPLGICMPRNVCSFLFGPRFNVHHSPPPTSRTNSNWVQRYSEIINMLRQQALLTRAYATLCEWTRNFELLLLRLLFCTLPTTGLKFRV